MTSEQVSEPLRRHVAAVVDAVRFDREPVDAVDRLMELIVATDVLSGTPADYLAAVRAALAGDAPVATLAPQPHTEGALRKLLRVLERRLDEWLPDGAAVTQLEFDTWRPTGPPEVAHLGREPRFLSRWLGVSFEAVADPMGEVRIAVLRLRSERVVALMQVAGNPAPGTTLLQAGSDAPAEVVDEFLADTQLSRSVVEWISPGQPVGG